MTWSHRCPVCTLNHSPHCPGSTARRWPLAPLKTLAGGTHDAVADRCGASGIAVTRAARDGLTDRQADTWATRMGMHPDLIWPEWTAAGLTVLDDLFVNGGGWRPRVEADDPYAQLPELLAETQELLAVTHERLAAKKGAA